MADVPDRDVVVLAPEERHRLETLLAAQDVARRGLSLPLRHHPVFHADAAATTRIGPACEVARGEDTRGTGLEEGVDDDPVVDGESGSLGQRCRRPDTDAGYDEVGLQGAAAAQMHPISV